MILCLTIYKSRAKVALRVHPLTLLFSVAETRATVPVASLFGMQQVNIILYWVDYRSFQKSVNCVFSSELFCCRLHAVYLLIPPGVLYWLFNMPISRAS